MDLSSRYVVGVDFGTLSGRALVVRCSDGAELASAVTEYPHQVLSETLPTTGEQLPPDWALQVPGDYLEVLRQAVPQAVRQAGIDPAQVIGIGTDFTACTVLPVTEDGTPLADLPQFSTHRHAYVKLWKHHSAQPQADRINRLAAERQEPWLARYGGLLSSEWTMAKGLQILEEDREVYDAMWHLVEAADWIVWRLGGAFLRNPSTAGYKDNLQDGAYPSPEYLTGLNPDFGRFFTDKVDGPLGDLGQVAGYLSAEAAGWTGLPEGIPVAVGNVDAHVALPAAQATEPGQLVAIMGTSTCHIVSDKELHVVPGMCGVVDGGVIAGMYGYEAGQSGVGDIFAWFVDHAVPAAYAQQAAEQGLGLHEYLTSLAQTQKPGEHGLLALDWLNGNRSVLVNHELSGMVLGLTLATRPEDIYRALVESTAYGTRVIVEAFVSSGVPVTELIVVGGLAKNPMVMQIYADVLQLPLSLGTSQQSPALGAAIHAAVAAGAYPDVTCAAQAMGSRQYAAYTPSPEASAVYDQLFAEYLALHDYFGRGTNEVMHRLRAIRRGALR